MSIPTTRPAPLRAKMMLKMPVPHPASRTAFPLTSSGEKNIGPVLFGLLVLGEIFRPDDIVEASDFLFVHGSRLDGKGQFSVRRRSKSIADDVLGVVFLDDLRTRLRKNRR